ncbi:DUF2759 domain-containing protein [Ectobacillus sp. sgz5001026]|jgi:uncharacterized membrane protein|uniref:DUF2759 domain-containing protein n=1 Tax=Ectobacillus sp. sgz5001026 TaxID=3242473 RepID=UPI0036D3D5D5
MKYSVVFIFSLVAFLAAYGVYKTGKEKNKLGIIFSFLTLVVFGWFTIMTIWGNGYPPVGH